MDLRSGVDQSRVSVGVVGKDTGYGKSHYKKTHDKGGEVNSH